MIDIDGAESFSPFRVWARGGQAPLRAQAMLPAVLLVSCGGHVSPVEPRRAIRIPL